MSIDIKTALVLVALAFLGGWYASGHQDQFFSWSRGVGGYWQQLINKECRVPQGYVCATVSPSLDKALSPSP